MLFAEINGMACFLFFILLIGMALYGLFQMWLMIERPDTYIKLQQAQWEREQARKRQTFSLVTFVFSMFLGK